MVKIGTGYINPARVLAVGPEGPAVRVHLGPGIFVDVTGMTPDEVHAALFPSPPLVGDAGGDIYTLALDISMTYADRLPASVVDLAKRIVGACEHK